MLNLILVDFSAKTANIFKSLIFSFLYRFYLLFFLKKNLITVYYSIFLKQTMQSCSNYSSCLKTLVLLEKIILLVKYLLKQHYLLHKSFLWCCQEEVVSRCFLSSFFKFMLFYSYLMSTIEAP